LSTDAPPGTTLKPDHSIFVVSNYYPPAGYNDRAADQVRILGHQADRLPAGWGVILHLLFSEEVAARVQEILVIVFPYQFLEFRRAQALLDKVAIVKVNSTLFHELARLAARRACRFLQEIDGLPGSLRSRSGLACRFRHQAFSSIAISLRNFIGNGNFPVMETWTALDEFKQDKTGLLQPGYIGAGRGGAPACPW
jgi:hypothetical protein